MKRSKNITVALTEAEADKIHEIAKEQRRPPAQLLYIIIADYLEKK